MSSCFRAVIAASSVLMMVIIVATAHAQTFPAVETSSATNANMQIQRNGFSLFKKKSKGLSERTNEGNIYSSKKKGPAASIRPREHEGRFLVKRKSFGTTARSNENPGQSLKRGKRNKRTMNFARVFRRHNQSGPSSKSRHEKRASVGYGDDDY